MIKIIKHILILFTIFYFNITLTKAGDQTTFFITGVGTSHFEAHRMAINSANSNGLRIKQQISQKSKDGLWHVIIKVSPK